MLYRLVLALQLSLPSIFQKVEQTMVNFCPKLWNEIDERFKTLPFKLFK